MKAIVQNAYGAPDVLELKEVDEPPVRDNEILIRVHASSVNAGDYFSMAGTPWLVRFSVGFPKPKNYILGWDAAGIVEKAGKNVTLFKPGDEVYGSCSHTFAEYVSSDQNKFAIKLPSLSFEQAAAVPTAGLTALQGLRDQAKMQPGQKVLINGASGGVGSFAVQIAKAFGAEVTGVCSPAKMETVRAIGADHVIDYTMEDFTQGETRYDVILDQAGSHPLKAYRRVLTPHGIHIPNTGHAGMAYVFKAMILSMFMRRHGRLWVAKLNHQDLVLLNELIQSGKVKPVIDRTVAFSETPQAVGYVGEGHAAGKVVIKMV